MGIAGGRRDRRGRLFNLTYPLWWPPLNAQQHATVPVYTPARWLDQDTFRVGSLPGAFGAFAAGAAMLLGPGKLEQRVTELDRARALAVDGSVMTLRRLERDLHDGAQIRLATLAMNLGLAKKKLAECGHQVCAAVGDPDSVLQAVAEHRPDAVIMDVRMPPTHTDEGLRAALTLRRHYPGTGVLVLSQYTETRYTAQLLQGSASGVGYLLKERVADVDEFADALARVASGGTALDPEVVSRLVSDSHHSAGLAALTPRERDVLTLMAEGRSNAGIAATLVVSASVVEKHAAARSSIREEGWHRPS